MALLPGLARGLPRRRLAARPDLPLAVADPGGRVRRLPVPQARHVAARTSGSVRSTGSRRWAAGWRSAATCPGRRGCSAAPSRPGSPASTSSTRSSTSRSTAPRGCTRGRPAGASAASFRGARVLHLLTVWAARRRRRRARRRLALLDRRRGRSPRCSSYEHSLVRPGDLRRLDAAFFTMNGVISVIFFGFVLADVLVAVIRARGLGRDYGTKRVIRGLDLDVDARRRSCSSPGRTAPARRRCSGCSPGCSSRPPASSRSTTTARADRLPRPRAARLPRADRAREPRPLRPALPRPRAARAHRHAARALRALGGAQRARRRRSRAG